MAQCPSLFPLSNIPTENSCFTWLLKSHQIWVGPQDWARHFAEAQILQQHVNAHRMKEANWAKAQPGFPNQATQFSKGHLPQDQFENGQGLNPAPCPQKTLFLLFVFSKVERKHSPSLLGSPSPKNSSKVLNWEQKALRLSYKDMLRFSSFVKQKKDLR